MSQENVEIVLKTADAVNGRDADAFVACLHPDVIWDDSAGFPGVRGVHRGQAEARKWFESVILEPWESLHLEVEEITEASDGRVFAVTLITARGRASSADTELRFWSAYRLAEGKIARRELFWDRDEALEAAGLSK
jgi:ketosteroid isomerase-like protein